MDIGLAIDPSAMKPIIGLCCGCFDCFHVGHLRYLQEARDHIRNHSSNYPVRLVVGLTLDKQVHLEKGIGKPVFSWDERYNILLALKMVDNVVAHSDMEATLRNVEPHYYFKGKEYEGRLPEQALCDQLGIKVVFTDTPVYSSTDILSGKLLNDRIRAARKRGE